MIDSTYTFTGIVRISYTAETRNGRATRHTKEVKTAKMESTIEKLSDRGAHSFQVEHEVSR